MTKVFNPLKELPLAINHFLQFPRTVQICAICYVLGLGRTNYTNVYFCCKHIIIEDAGNAAQSFHLTASGAELQ